MAFDERGRPSFERLQQRMHLTREAEIRRRAQEVPVHYMLFDVLYLEGRSMMEPPLRGASRGARVDGARGPGVADAALPPRPGRRAARGQRRPGPGGRGGEAPRQPLRARAALVGLDQGQEQAAHGARDRRLAAGEGAPEATRRAAGRLPRRTGGSFATPAAWGRAGTRRSARGWSELLAPLARDALTVRGQSAGRRGARYVEPRLVAEIEFTEWTNERMLRHPSYKGLVEMEPEQVVLENPARSAVGSGQRRSGGGGGPRQRGNDGFARAGPEGRARTRSRWRSRAARCGCPISTSRCIRRRDSPRAT